MLQRFHLDVAKVDQDVARCGRWLSLLLGRSLCCKCFIWMLQWLYTYVARVCPKCFHLFSEYVTVSVSWAEKLLQTHAVPVGKRNNCSRRWHSNRQGATSALAHRQVQQQQEARQAAVAADAAARGHFLSCSAFLPPYWIIGFRF
jgi:hypothetical protein